MGQLRRRVWTISDCFWKISASEIILSRRTRTLAVVIGLSCFVAVAVWFVNRAISQVERTAVQIVCDGETMLVTAGEHYKKITPLTLSRETILKYGQEPGPLNFPPNPIGEELYWSYLADGRIAVGVRGKAEMRLSFYRIRGEHGYQRHKHLVLGWDERNARLALLPRQLVRPEPIWEPRKKSVVQSLPR